MEGKKREFGVHLSMVVSSILMASLVFAGTFFSGTILADDALWFSEIALGGVATTGNTDERNLKLRIVAKRDNSSTRFAQKFHIDALNNSKDKVKTAQKIYGFYELDYKLQNNSAIYGRVSYEDDRFSGFDYQADLTMGYDRQLFENKKMLLKGNLGVGVRVSQLEVGDRENEVILRVGGDYRWQLSSNSVFEQILSAEIGSDATIMRSETSLSSDIVGNLAMKLALNVKHQSEVPVGSEKTDTETSVTLVYKF